MRALVNSDNRSACLADEADADSRPAEDKSGYSHGAPTRAAQKYKLITAPRSSDCSFSVLVDVLRRNHAQPMLHLVPGLYSEAGQWSSRSCGCGCTIRYTAKPLADRPRPLFLKPVSDNDEQAIKHLETVISAGPSRRHELPAALLAIKPPLFEAGKWTRAMDEIGIALRCAAVRGGKDIARAERPSRHRQSG